MDKEMMKKEEEGATLVEYALLVALIAIPSIKAFQKSSTCQYNNANNQLAHLRRGDSLGDQCPADDSDEGDDYGDDGGDGDYDQDDPTTTVLPTSTIVTTSSIMTTSSIPTTTSIDNCPARGTYCGTYLPHENVGPECADFCCRHLYCMPKPHSPNKVDCYCG